MLNENEKDDEERKKKAEIIAMDGYEVEYGRSPDVIIMIMK